MKHVALALGFIFFGTLLFAQSDTIRIGGMTIVRSGEDKRKEIRIDTVIIKRDTSYSLKRDSMMITVDTLKVGSITIISKGLKKGLQDINESLTEIDIKGFGEDIKESLREIELKDRMKTLKDKFKRKPKKISTNWFVFDIGFSGYNDQTNYATSEAQRFLRPTGIVSNSSNNYSLRTSRVSNFSLWFLMQRLSIAKSVLNLKYGLGIESNNYFYKTGITYVDEPEVYTIDKGRIFSKNKLVANYLTVPLMVNINTNPSKGRKAFQFSAGVSGGYLIASRQKQKTGNGMDKVKSNFNLEPFKLAYVGELGLGPVKIFGSYAMTPLHKYGLEQFPYSVGIRFSN